MALAKFVLNGAAARKVHKGDLVIIAAFAEFEQEEAFNYKPQLVMVDDANGIKQIHHEYAKKFNEDYICAVELDRRWRAAYSRCRIRKIQVSGGRQPSQTRF